MVLCDDGSKRFTVPPCIIELKTGEAFKNPWQKLFDHVNSWWKFWLVPFWISTHSKHLIHIFLRIFTKFSKDTNQYIQLTLQRHEPGSAFSFVILLNNLSVIPRPFPTLPERKSGRRRPREPLPRAPTRNYQRTVEPACGFGDDVSPEFLVFRLHARVPFAAFWSFFHGILQERINKTRSRFWTTGQREFTGDCGETRGRVFVMHHKYICM